jgi:pyrroloquinoline quinone biosynthesis protein D
MLTSLPDEARPRLARGVRLHIDCTTGKAALLFPEGILELNETAQEILSRCDGRSLGEITADLAKEYECDVATITADVRGTLADLERRKLVELA